MWLGKYLAYRAQPLTQLQLGNELPSLRNPLPMGEGLC
jgi:hypothetical protein